MKFTNPIILYTQLYIYFPNIYWIVALHSFVYKNTDFTTSKIRDIDKGECNYPSQWTNEWMIWFPEIQRRRIVSSSSLSGLTISVSFFRTQFQLILVAIIAISYNELRWLCLFACIFRGIRLYTRRRISKEGYGFWKLSSILLNIVVFVYKESCRNLRHWILMMWIAFSWGWWRVMEGLLLLVGQANWQSPLATSPPQTHPGNFRFTA